MKVSTFVRDLSDAGLRWVKQIGIDEVVLRLEYIPEYADTGCLEEDTLRNLVDRFDSFGLRIGMVNLAITHLWDIYFDRPGAAKQLENIQLLFPRLSKAGIDLIGIKPNNAQYLPPAHIPGKTEEFGRGGYDSLVNIDHIPTLEGDTPDWKMGSSWLVGYTRALLRVRDPISL